MDTSQWTQRNIGVVDKPMEASNSTPAILERRARPQKDQALNCPRCNSTNTKFCYYNNYNLSQPRYFCKSCRRYWTEGGSLRNVPVGGGSRKNKKSIISSSSSSSTRKLPDHLTTPNFSQSTNSDQNPRIQQGQDLNLAYSPSEDYNKNLSFIEAPYNSTENHSSNSAVYSRQLSARELLKSGIANSSSRGLNSFIPLSVSNSGTMYGSTGLTLKDFKPAVLRFSFANNGYGGLEEIEGQGSSSARILFPPEDLKQIPTIKHEFEQNRSIGDSTGYWNGIQRGGPW